MACIGDTSSTLGLLSDFSIDTQEILSYLTLPEAEHKISYETNPIYNHFYNILKAAEFHSYLSDFNIHQAYGIPGPFFPVVTPMRVPDYQNMPSVMDYHSGFASNLMQSVYGKSILNSNSIANYQFFPSPLSLGTNPFYQVASVVGVSPAFQSFP